MSWALGILTVLAGSATGWLVMRRFDPLPRLYEWRLDIWQEQVRVLRKALIEEIAEGSRAAELLIEADLNRALAKRNFYRDMIASHERRNHA